MATDLDVDMVMYDVVRVRRACLFTLGWVDFIKNINW